MEADKALEGGINLILAWHASYKSFDLRRALDIYFRTLKNTTDLARVLRPTGEELARQVEITAQIVDELLEEEGAHGR